jgi:cytochrome c-type biogenesis protein CcmH
VTSFWIAAASLCAAAVAIVLWPLWRARRAFGRWSALGLASAFAIIPVAFALYTRVSNWDPATTHRANEGARVVQQLADRLRETPDDVEGWLLLARSYMTLGRYAEGRDAYREAWRRSPVRDNELKVSYAEAQVLADRAALAGDAGPLFEEVLAAEPNNMKALWYGGLVALEAGKEADFQARWTRLLELDPPEDLANVVRGQLAALGAPAAGSDSSVAGGSVAPSGPAVRLNVTLGAGRAVEQLGPNAALFIFARAPGERAPLAVIRQPAGAVPGEFTLSDANSMIPGRSLADYDELTLVARLSRSGQPNATAGDWEGQTQFRPKEGGAVALVIDQVVQ